MSTEETKAIVQRFYLEVHEQGNIAAINVLFAPNCVHHSVQLRDNEWLKQGIAELRAAFPGYRVTVENLIAEDDKVANSWTFHGTHSGAAFRGIAPTGRDATLVGITIWRIADGKIVEVWNSADALGFGQQLGMFPPAGRAGK